MPRATHIGMIRVALTTLLLCVSALPARADFEQRNARVIDMEWSHQVVPQNIPYNLAAMQDIPFGGLVTDLVKNMPNDVNKSDIFSWNAWGSQPINPAEFSQSINALTNLSWGNYEDVYLRMNVTPGGMDWFDDQSVAMANSQWISGVTQQTNLRGIFFDPEFYSDQSKVFHYESQPQAGLHTFAQYAARVQQRGMEYMNALKAGNPNVRVLLAFGPEPHGVEYNLLPYFIDGMKSAAGPANTIYNGWEGSYSYRGSTEFESAYETMRQQGLGVGYGVWLDTGNTFDAQNIGNNYYTPQQFQFAVQEAAKRTDRNIWLFTNNLRWFNGSMPQEYVQALQDVRKQGQIERFTGTTKEPAVWSPYVQGSGGIGQNDKIMVDGVGISGASVVDYTTKTLTLGVGEVLAVEITNNTSTSSSGYSQFAKLGIALTNDSGGTTAGTLSDTRLASLFWSNNDNKIYIGINDANGTDQLITLVNNDQPTGSTYVYQIERLSIDSARFNVYDASNGSWIGGPVTWNLSGIPGDLSISLFSQGADGAFDNVWIGHMVPEPSMFSIPVMLAAIFWRRRSIGRG